MESDGNVKNNNLCIKGFSSPDVSLNTEFTESNK